MDAAPRLLEQMFATRPATQQRPSEGRRERPEAAFEALVAERPPEPPRRERAEAAGRRLPDRAPAARRAEPHAGRETTERPGNPEARGADARREHAGADDAPMEAAGDGQAPETLEAGKEKAADPVAGSDATATPGPASPAAIALAPLAAVGQPLTAAATPAAAVPAMTQAAGPAPVETVAGQPAGEAAGPGAAAAAPPIVATSALLSGPPAPAGEPEGAATGGSAPVTGVPRGTAPAIHAAGNEAPPDAARMVTGDAPSAPAPSAAPAMARPLPDAMPAAAAENRPAGAIDAPAALGGSRDPAAASLHAAPAEARRSPEPAVPLAALAVEVGMRAVKGAREFSISLDPDELGRVDVTLRIDDQGAVKAEVRVERVETLQLLQRDARTLERAFEQAGLRNGGDMLQFSLSGGERQGGGQSREDNRTRTRKSDTEAAEALSPGAIARYARPAAVGLDIHI